MRKPITDVETRVLRALFECAGQVNVETIYDADRPALAYGHCRTRQLGGRRFRDRSKQRLTPRILPSGASKPVPIDLVVGRQSHSACGIHRPWAGEGDGAL